MAITISVIKADIGKYRRTHQTLKRHAIGN